MLSKHDIKKLADLVRIEVTDHETERLQHDLERILGYVEQLNRAETGAVESITHVQGLSNVMALDDARAVVESHTAELLQASSHYERSFIKVPSIWKKQ